MNATIQIARAVRNWHRGIGEATLVWRCHESKLGVEYKELTDQGYRTDCIPDQCVKNWLRTFVRDQRQLQPDSYYLVDPPQFVWQEILLGLIHTSQSL